MAGYAYDLGPRQSSRIIEQAIRQHANVWAETIEQSQPRAFSGYMISGTAEMITIQLNVPCQDTFSPLMGQYYQLIISTSDTRYLTVCDLLEVQVRDESLFLVFSRPKNLQVMQRRCYCRHIPGQSIAVYLSWQKQDSDGETMVNTPALGQIKDLSLHGMSIRVPEKLDNHLFIGDTVYVRFSLNVREAEYFTSAQICYKELRHEQSELILGLQFLTAEENGEFQTRLRTALTQDIVTKKGL